MKELNSDNLNEIISAHKAVIVQYGASWCGACRIIKPKFAKLAEENQNIEFYYVDAEKFPNSRSEAKVDNLPTFAGFVEGKLISQMTGTKEEKIKEIIDEIANH